MEHEAVPTEDLIRSGEIKGREALEYLRSTDLYVFHGSPERIEVLEPRQALSHGQPDGEPAVAATTDIDQAIFRALIHRLRDQKAGRNHRSGWVGTENGMQYLALDTSIEALTSEDKGFVYALAREGNRFFAFRSEMRSLQPVTPDFKVEVHKEDLPEVKTFDTAEKLHAYQEALRRLQENLRNGRQTDEKPDFDRSIDE